MIKSPISNGILALVLSLSALVHSEGRLPQTNQFPWIVLIEVFKDTTHPRTQCTGNLITSNWVLTSADCLDLMTNEGYIIAVQLGSNYRKKIVEGEQIQETTEYYIYPYYDQITAKNNVALIKLAKKPFIDDHVQVISTSVYYDEDKFMSTIVGWPSSSYSSASLYGDILTYDILTAITNDECQNHYRKTNIAIERNEICTSDYNTFDSAKLAFDTGASLIKYKDQTRVLIGIAGKNAFNSPRNASKFPVRYARVSEYVEWIGYQITLWDLKNDANSTSFILYLVVTLFVIGILM